MKLLSVLLLFFVALCAQAKGVDKVNGKELTIAVEPTFLSGQVDDVFQPLSDWLAENMGYTLKVVTSQNYYFYWKDATTDIPDLTFDAPHIAAYRIQNKNYRPVVRTVEDLRFHLVVDQSNADRHSDLESLRTTSIATMQHPSLASVVYEQWFSQSIVMPNKVLSEHTWRDGVDLIFEGMATATIIPESTFELYPNLISVEQSQAFPGMTLLASPHLSEAVVNRLTDVLLQMRFQGQAHEVFYELNTEYFVAADQADYSELDQLIPRSYQRQAQIQNGQSVISGHAAK